MRWIGDAALGHLRGLAADPGASPDAASERYEIVEEIGRGGMGTVYLARDLNLDRDVALKVLNDAAEPDAVERMRREARILARLEHPGIVPVHDVGTLPDGRVFYAMKRVRGERLDAFAARTASLPERLRVFVRICEAVAFAHAHGVVHRDLKPQNVMVGSFGEVLVLDWGIARLRASGDATSSIDAHPSMDARPSDGPVDASKDADFATSARTAHGTVMGTPGFMAPEQARGEVEQVDERADVFALGAILRFLLDAGPSLAAAPRPLAAVAARAMASDPAERYAAVDALAAEVSRWLDGLSVAAYRESAAERARRLFAKYQTPILLVLAYLLMRMLFILFAD